MSTENLLTNSRSSPNHGSSLTSSSSSSTPIADGQETLRRPLVKDTKPTTLSDDKSASTVGDLTLPPYSLLQVEDDTQFWNKRKAALISSCKKEEGHLDVVVVVNSDDVKRDGSQMMDGSDPTTPVVDNAGESHAEIKSSLDQTETETDTGRNTKQKIDCGPSSEQQQQQQQKIAPNKVTVSLTHFAGQALPVKRYGSCGVCGLDETENDDDILLCDGAGCGQEFHLRCCRPPLKSIPDGDFFCFDCCPYGSTKYLQSYLDKIENQRENYLCDLPTADGEDHFEGGLKKKKPGRKAAGKKSTVTLFREELYSTVSQTVEEMAESFKQKGSKSSKEVPSESSDANTKKRQRGRPPSKDKPTTKPTKKKDGSVSYQNKELDFVDRLLLRQMVLQHPERFIKGGKRFFESLIRKRDDELSNPSKSSKKTPSKDPLLPISVVEARPKTIRVPYSELQMWFGMEEHDVSSLIGRTIKLYCPMDDQYHTGRILIARRPPSGSYGTNDDDDDNDDGKDHKPRVSKSDHSISSSPSPSSLTTDIECLVRFSAGKDHRKTTLTQWIRLEEHSVLVAVDCRWGRRSKLTMADPPLIDTPSTDTKSTSVKSTEPTKHNKADSSLPATTTTTTEELSSSTDQQHHLEWARGMLWIRTSSELLNVLDMLDEKQGQVEFRTLRNRHGNKYIYDNLPLRNPSTVGKPKWGLFGFWDNTDLKPLEIGVETLEEDTNSLLSTSSETRSTSSTNLPLSLHNSQAGRLNLALEMVELAEQSRVRKWSMDLPIEQCRRKLCGPTCYDEHHKGGLTLVDEDEQLTNPKATMDIDISPTPLVKTGLDRLYLLDQAPMSSSVGGNEKLTVPTKDVAWSLLCSKMDASVSDSVKTINQNHQRWLSPS